MNIRGLIFDLDGTLIDSMMIWDNIGTEYLLSQGIKCDGKELKEVLKSLSLQQATEYFIKKYNITKSSSQITSEIILMVEDKYRYEVPLKDGVLEFLEKYSHLKMCIATACERHIAKYALKRLKIDKYFDFIITSNEVGNSKKSPDIFLQATKRLGLEKENVIIFEDAYHAIKTAKKANFYVCGVYEMMFDSEKDKIKELSDCYVNNLMEFEVV